ncbi:hypothetical protein JOC73_000273 [Alkaliphilus hydrothermalis]|uniref:Uncharacterized protein n=1 Tax=Alkaliphilus hydrothermalis TaxID=1482730 RepID=A0ABS2NLG7_9FIRM|nr:hypothetical protein [Alkaliphilus hydrothermalis]
MKLIVKYYKVFKNMLKILLKTKLFREGMIVDKYCSHHHSFLHTKKAIDYILVQGDNSFYCSQIAKGL